MHYTVGSTHFKYHSRVDIQVKLLISYKNHATLQKLVIDIDKALKYFLKSCAVSRVGISVVYNFDRVSNMSDLAVVDFDDLFFQFLFPTLLVIEFAVVIFGQSMGVAENVAALAFNT